MQQASAVEAVRRAATPMTKFRKVAVMETCESDSDDIRMYTPKPKRPTSAILKSSFAASVMFSVFKGLCCVELSLAGCLNIMQT